MGPNLKWCVKCKNILKPNLKEVLWLDFAHLEYDQNYKSYLIDYSELVLHSVFLYHKSRVFMKQFANTEKNIWVANFFLPQKKLAFTDHLVIFTIFGGWVGPPHSKNSKNY